MRKEKMVINRKGAIEKIYEGTCIKFSRNINGKIEWGVNTIQTSSDDCKTKKEAKNILTLMINLFIEEENENQYQ